MTHQFDPFGISDQADFFEQPSVDELIAQHSLDSLNDPCNNCGTLNWAAKNDNYCTACERQWYDAWRQMIHPCGNMHQGTVDKILKEYGI